MPRFSFSWERKASMEYLINPQYLQYLTNAVWAAALVVSATSLLGAIALWLFVRIIIVATASANDGGPFNADAN